MGHIYCTYRLPSLRLKSVPLPSSHPNETMKKGACRVACVIIIKNNGIRKPCFLKQIGDITILY